MPVWVSDIIVRLFQSFGAWLLAQAIAHAKAENLIAATDEDVDKRLAALKEAYKGAFNGQPITADDKKNIRIAITEFVSGNDPRGL